jgi:uncharacterized Fe-S cluster protein YjdI
MSEQPWIEQDELNPEEVDAVVDAYITACQGDGIICYVDILCSQKG